MSLEKEITDYNDHITDIKHWTTLKGEYRYEIIIRFLKSKKIECSWANVTYYIKYDKRLLINSFKYIVFLEELYKSFVIKNKEVKIDDLKKYGFSKALEEYLSIGDNANYDDIDLELLRKEKNAIVAFRNKVVHNKVLLDLNYSCQKSLESILNIFVKILPKSYREGFIKEINSSAKGIVDKSWHIELVNN